MSTLFCRLVTWHHHWTWKTDGVDSFLDVIDLTPAGTANLPMAEQRRWSLKTDGADTSIKSTLIIHLVKHRGMLKVSSDRENGLLSAAMWYRVSTVKSKATRLLYNRQMLPNTRKTSCTIRKWSRHFGYYGLGQITCKWHHTSILGHYLSSGCETVTGCHGCYGGITAYLYSIYPKT